METRNIIVENVLDFGLEVVRFCELLNERRRFVVSNQLLRSGTSVGETLFWLLICERSSNYPESSSLKIMVEEIIRIISKIIITSQGGFRHC